MENQKKYMKKGVIIFVLIAVLILAIVLIFSGKSKEPGQYDEFAQCLNNAGLKMYGTEWCPHCKNQKSLFGKSFQYVDYIDCDRNKDNCLIQGIQGYPTWKLNGQSYTGEQSLENLAQITGCTLE